MEPGRVLASLTAPQGGAAPRPETRAVVASVSRAGLRRRARPAAGGAVTWPEVAPPER